ITMEDFLELEEFLELEDGENLKDWDIDKEITMEYFLELEKFLKDTHLAVPTHMRPPICAEEAAWFHKRLKRLHDPVKQQAIVSESKIHLTVYQTASYNLRQQATISDSKIQSTSSPISIYQLETRDEMVRGDWDLISGLGNQRWAGLTLLGKAHFNNPTYNGVFDDHMNVVAYQRGLRFRGEIDKGPTEAASVDTSTSSLIDTRRVSKQKEFEACRNIFD
ncbi:hypothetical protein HID58_069326, partial [Brassica napus]